MQRMIIKNYYYNLMRIKQKNKPNLNKFLKDRMKNTTKKIHQNPQKKIKLLKDKLRRLTHPNPQKIKLLKQKIMKSINRNTKVLSSMKMIKLQNNQLVQMPTVNNHKPQDNQGIKENQNNMNQKLKSIPQMMDNVEPSLLNKLRRTLKYQMQLSTK